MRRSIAALTVMLHAFLAALVHAQATGTVTGVVTDPSESVLPGVAIEIKSAATNQTRLAITGNDGFYIVPLLQPGIYTVKATLAGFRPTERAPN